MKELFLTKVKYTKQLENGSFKRVVEQYLFDGYTFTDCEANIYKHLGEIIRGEFIVDKIDRFQVDKVIGQGDKFFIVKQTYLNIDNREVKLKLLVIDNMIEGAKTRVALFNDDEQILLTAEIKSIVETKILEYFKSEEEVQG